MSDGDIQFFSNTTGGTSYLGGRIENSITYGPLKITGGPTGEDGVSIPYLFATSIKPHAPLGTTIGTNTSRFQELHVEDIYARDYVNADRMYFTGGGETGSDYIDVADHGAYDWMDFYVDGHYSMSIGGDGNVWIDGGLYVGGSVAANLLDDYEEGYYTATLTSSSGSVTLSTGTDILAYTKVGRQVTITGQLTVSSVSSPSGSLTLDLPFPIGAIAESGERFATHLLYGGLNALAAGGTVALYGLTGSTAYFSEENTTGSSTSFADHIKAGSLFYFSFTYFAAT